MHDSVDLFFKLIPALGVFAAIIGSWYLVRYQVSKAEESIKSNAKKIELLAESNTTKIEALTNAMRQEAKMYASKEMLSLVEANLHTKLSEKFNIIHDQLNNLIIEVRELRHDYKELLKERRG